MGEMKTAPFLGVLALLTMAPSAFAVGDPVGQGAELYVPPKARIQSIAMLRKEVARWGERYDPGISKQDIEDLVEWLNRNFYKLEK
ncbi:MAG: hypothetical protein A3D95_02215 [Betaproteobacteria bacterium RIFCSPHIGHO2_12_FULL_69_13]|nr:MAG: hypothetical protein A3D95_02215 [Betaproteobacteria bacterium RIFCSPHIGHO2_12_FULL_69_13]OGA70322.1 MAG: hypothetical protein A3G83_06125 [Betaproteobacteria bacterium RIFCSPLOWO2_12_FULL_68_20]